MVPIYILYFVILFSNITIIKDTDKAVGKYVKEFEDRCNCEIDFPVKIEKDEQFDSDIVGICYRLATKRYVRLDKWFLLRASEDQIRHLVYHELAHCKFDADHDERIMDTPYGEYPASLMYPEIFMYPKKHLQEYYYKQLFGELTPEEEYPIVGTD